LSEVGDPEHRWLFTGKSMLTFNPSIVAASVKTCYHASSTCLMERHTLSVVDNELRVHGLEGLRVIDGLVMRLPPVSKRGRREKTAAIPSSDLSIRDRPGFCPDSRLKS
jgi:hypothetical protein